MTIRRLIISIVVAPFAAVTQSLNDRKQRTRDTLTSYMDMSMEEIDDRRSIYESRRGFPKNVSSMHIAPTGDVFRQPSNTIHVVDAGHGDHELMGREISASAGITDTFGWNRYDSDRTSGRI